MIRRHPHVFGVDGAKTPEAALENWEDIKKKEKHEDTLTEGMRRVAKIPSGEYPRGEGSEKSGPRRF